MVGVKDSIGWQFRTPVQLNSSVLETIQTRTYLQMHFFFRRMTDVMTSQNIDISSVDTSVRVCVCVCIYTQKSHVPISADSVSAVSVICGLPQPEKKFGKLEK
jgi:hypothetical protein